MCPTGDLGYMHSAPSIFLSADGGGRNAKELKERERKLVLVGWCFVFCVFGCGWGLVGGGEEKKREEKRDIW